MSESVVSLAWGFFWGGSLEDMVVMGGRMGGVARVVGCS